MDRSRTGWFQVVARVGGVLVLGADARWLGGGTYVLVARASTRRAEVVALEARVGAVLAGGT